MKSIIKWQQGTVAENGVNGMQVVDVLIETYNHVKQLDKEFPSEENKYTLVNLLRAIDSQQARTEDRVERGVEGKYLK